jgi:hypothetical protein
MGNTNIKTKINFEDMQFIIQNPTKYTIINTLPDNLQHCLILNTLSVHDEIKTINSFISSAAFNKNIVIYGKNNNDQSIINKYQYLINKGFENVYIYLGGMFEWLLLQDIYGSDEFKTTSKELDLLKYKPNNII